MEQTLNALYAAQPLPLLFLVIAVLFVVLAKGADMLVDEAVCLSVKWGVSKGVIGATVVSHGTTLPEAAVSVLAAIQGRPGLALGNAVGSIICDTGLILGLATLISPPRIDRAIVDIQGRTQLGAAILLVGCCLPLGSLSTVFARGGHLPQVTGIGFLLLLVAYIWLSIQWARKDGTVKISSESKVDETAAAALAAFVRLVLGIAFVVVSSHLLIPAVQEVALRLGVPETTVAATLVAFGTSLPELVTAVTASVKGHGELAVGNVVGADILNVLFVAGAAASATPGGLSTSPHFFKVLFPAMLGVLIAFRIGVVVSKERLSRVFGVVLLVVYILVTLVSYA